jgi:hypothetical protein
MQPHRVPLGDMIAQPSDHFARAKGLLTNPVDVLVLASALPSPAANNRLSAPAWLPTAVSG